MPTKKTIKSLIDDNGEVRTLTAGDIAQMQPMGAVLPELVALYKASRGRPKKAQTAKAVSIRLDPDVEQYFRSLGRGWQTRINDVLRGVLPQ